MHLNAGETPLTARKDSKPWLTLMYGCAAAVCWLSPAMNRVFLYQRDLISQGEWWRLWTGHLAHHGGSHFLWNIVVFLPAGTWLERLAPPPARWFLGVGPLFISLALWFFDPRLAVYAGLSGLTVGTVMLLALVHLQAGPREPRWLWSGLLALISIKIGWEYFRPGDALFAGLPPGFWNVPLAHLAGAIGASLVALFSLSRGTGSR